MRCNYGYGYKGRRRKGFTLIELLVVVAIIALLISILLPSLSSARKQARAVKCAANLRSVGQAFGLYLAENNAMFPPSYMYPHNAAGDVDLNNQPYDHAYGYVHWSYFLFNNGQVKWEAFECPDFPKGGTPRTNPGPLKYDWEYGAQRDQNSQSEPNALQDRQAPRMAYTANAAVIPRNKLKAYMVPGKPRHNQFVSEARISEPRGVIVAGELHTNWKASAIGSGGGYLSKSHRSVSAFFNESTNADEYAAPNYGGFYYGIPGHPTYGLRPLNELEDMIGVIETGADGPEVNAIGRHHPGGDKLGGTSNFLYTDGHVERKTILQTMKDREWGSEYYSLTGGGTKIRNENE